MVQRALNRWTRGLPIPVSGVYDQRTSDRVMAFQAAEGIRPANGDFGQDTLDALWPYFDTYGRWRYRLFRPPPPRKLPDLGPVWRGGRSVLDQDLTHATAGIARYPAFDDAFTAGEEVIAPEDLRVTRPSSSIPGHAFYATGASGIRYWFGHLDRTPPVGRRFRRGETMARVAPNSVGGGPHVHVGINVEGILGSGRELEHRTDYRHGAPKVGEQLRRALH
ncbi:MAG: hypothetical protein KatS3mg015_2457 [Fimbriimonadales bacterium]|nr:MAG: hypothetical protein KatS3mg015_2457 [Fimbriimonadales bacterium]